MDDLGVLSTKLDKVLERLDAMEQTVVSIEGTLKVDIDLATKPLGETHVGVGDKVSHNGHLGTVAWLGVDTYGNVNAGVQYGGVDGEPREELASLLTRVVT